jgi:hypothetical protein
MGYNLRGECWPDLSASPLQTSRERGPTLTAARVVVAGAAAAAAIAVTRGGRDCARRPRHDARARKIITT